MYSLESPREGDSNEYIQYTISQHKKESHPKLFQICNYGICSKGLKKEFQTAVVNEPSVFEPLKFYCSIIGFHLYFCEFENFIKATSSDFYYLFQLSKIYIG